jgi:hypothetical protein
VSGVWIDGGTFAAYFGAGFPCAQADAANSATNASIAIFMRSLLWL